MPTPHESIHRADVRFRQGLGAAGLLAVSLALGGCTQADDAPKLATLFPVKGKVLLPDGKPLAAGRVVMVSSDGLTSPSGPVTPDGTFTISSGDGQDGAPAGDYKVRIEPVLTSKRGAKAPFLNRYTDEDASGLKVSVKPEPNDLALKLAAKDDRPEVRGESRGRD